LVLTGWLVAVEKDAMGQKLDAMDAAEANATDETMTAAITEGVSLI